MKLQITFVSLPAVNATIDVHFDPNYPSLPSYDFSRLSIFKIARINPGEVAIGTDVNAQALNYYNAFLADYGADFNVAVLANVITIEARNGSDVFDYSASSAFVNFASVSSGVSNNVIHEIIFTPKVYAYPAIMNRDYLITEDNYLVITEDNYKIRL